MSMAARQRQLIFFMGAAGEGVRAPSHSSYEGTDSTDKSLLISDFVHKIDPSEV